MISKNNKFKALCLVMSACMVIIVMGLLGVTMSGAQESQVIANAPEAGNMEPAPIANVPEQTTAEPAPIQEEPSEVIAKEQPKQYDGPVAFPMPSTHKGNWIKYHGTYVPLNMNEAGQRGTACYVCHEIGSGSYFAYLWSDALRAPV